MIEIASISAVGHGVGGARDRGLASRPARLHDVRLSVDAGSVTAIVGTESDGTSLLLTIAAGRARPSRGVVRVAGAPPGRARRSIAHVPAAPSLPLELTVARALRQSAALRREPLRDPIERLAQLSIEHLAPARIESLDPAERRSVAMALAVTSHAEVLLLDEPFQHLTAPAAARLPTLLRARAAEGAAVLVATASAAEAHRVADRTFALRRGALALLESSAAAVVRIVLRDVAESEATASARFIQALAAAGSARVISSRGTTVTVEGDSLDALATAVTAALDAGAVNPHLIEIVDSKDAAHEALAPSGELG